MPRYCLAGDVYLHAPGGSRRVAPAVILYLLAPRVLPSSGRFAADPRRRRSLSFAVEHDEPPDLGLERLSVSTRQKDAGVGHGLDDKQHFYAACGVREYWLYGPEGYRTDGGPVLQGCRLHAQAYREIAPVPEGALWWSDELQTHWGLPPPPLPGGTASRASTPSYACATRRAGLGMPRNTNGSGSAGRIKRGWPRQAAQTAEKAAQMARLQRQLGLDASGGDERAEAQSVPALGGRTTPRPAFILTQVVFAFLISNGFIPLGLREAGDA